MSIAICVIPQMRRLNQIYLQLALLHLVKLALLHLVKIPFKPQGSPATAFSARAMNPCGRMPVKMIEAMKKMPTNIDGTVREYEAMREYEARLPS